MEEAHHDQIMAPSSPSKSPPQNPFSTPRLPPPNPQLTPSPYPPTKFTHHHPHTPHPHSTSPPHTPPSFNKLPLITPHLTPHSSLPIPTTIPHYPSSNTFSSDNLPPTSHPPHPSSATFPPSFYITYTSRTPYTLHPLHLPYFDLRDRVERPQPVSPGLVERIVRETQPEEHSGGGGAVSHLQNPSVGEADGLRGDLVHQDEVVPESG